MSNSPTSFGARSNAAEVIAGLDLTGKRAVVTGGSSGIGIETARALAGAHAEVTLAVRNLDAGHQVAGEINASTGGKNVLVAPLELADLDSVAAFAANWQGPLDILVNNAGVMNLPERILTAEGHELQFATNHLGHFALALGLHDALAAAGNARIVSLSSRGHLRSPVVFDDIDFTGRPYDPMLAYGQSKTANILFAVEANRRWSAEGITANAVHPGVITETNLARHMDPEVLATLLAASHGTILKTVEQGAATSVLVATSPALDGIGGRYFENCAEATLLESATPSTSPTGVAPYALDPGNAARLWQVSLDMLTAAGHRPA
ncbi:oxidoreductase [Acrocarpospora corrugata]|uniref:Probable oxidoreductase n=1 Tax=Acrocarpospora corrugata TaxID=35763 RepID=A0A5M3VQI0_9ACTN|nr:SDR family NAD(P)-dependent oxidoreductase [Acrocarpospora corrugata]GER98733.1 oxidoreductase [Acrocarpospora corrugata]